MSHWKCSFPALVCAWEHEKQICVCVKLVSAPVTE